MSISFTCGDTGVEVKDLKLDRRDGVFIQQYIDLLDGKTILDNSIRNDLIQNGEPYPYQIPLRHCFSSEHGLSARQVFHFRYWLYLMKVFMLRRY